MFCRHPEKKKLGHDLERGGVRVSGWDLASEIKGVVEIGELLETLEKRMGPLVAGLMGS